MKSLRRPSMPALCLLLLTTGCHQGQARGAEAQTSGSVTDAHSATGRSQGGASLPAVTPELGLKGMTLKAALQQPFDGPYQVTLQDAQRSAKTLNDCADYLAVEGRVYSAGSDQDYRSLLHEGARCEALGLLDRARPAPSGAFQNFTFTGLKVSDLPPEFDLLISRESIGKAKELAVAGGSLLDMDPGLRLRPAGPYRAELNARDWTGSLIDYGHADLYGNGKDELLLLREAKAKGGTYAASDLFVVTRSTSGRLQVVEQHPPTSFNAANSDAP